MQANDRRWHHHRFRPRGGRGEYVDLGGPALRAEAGKYGWNVAAEAVVPDDVGRIQETPSARLRHRAAGLILTTGGTGIAPRDVTPEAIRALMRVELPGFGEAMRARFDEDDAGTRSCPARLAAVVDRALVIALPGQPAGAVECLGYVAGAVEHGVKLAARLPTSC